jgi:hypothetical protein
MAWQQGVRRLSVLFSRWPSRFRSSAWQGLPSGLQTMNPVKQWHRKGIVRAQRIPTQQQVKGNHHFTDIAFFWATKALTEDLSHFINPPFLSFPFELLEHERRIH